MRAVELGGGFGFAAEALHELVVVSQIWWQDLDGNDALGLGVVGLTPPPLACPELRLIGDLMEAARGWEMSWRRTASILLGL